MAEAKKTKAIVSLRALDEKALQQKIAELRAQLAEQQRSLAAQELPNPRAITSTRKQIAQALTVLAEGPSKVAPQEEK